MLDFTQEYMLSMSNLKCICVYVCMLTRLDTQVRSSGIFKYFVNNIPILLSYSHFPAT